MVIRCEKLSFVLLKLHLDDVGKDVEICPVDKGVIDNLEDVAAVLDYFVVFLHDGCSDIVLAEIVVPLLLFLCLLNWCFSGLIISKKITQFLLVSIFDGNALFGCAY
jgi:hypothetical protein